MSRRPFLQVKAAAGSALAFPYFIRASALGRNGAVDNKVSEPTKRNGIMLMSKFKFTLLVVLLLGGAQRGPAQNAAREQETKLIAVLKSNAAYDEKADACRELARMGTAASVPALAALLADEKLSHLARYALEPMPGLAVDDALRDALGQLKGRPLVGVIGSIGMRRDPRAVEALVGFLKDSDTEISQAAARSLGRIGTPAAANGLQGRLAVAAATNQLALYDGLLSCANTLAAKGQRAKALAIYDALRRQPQAPHQVRAGAWRGAILTRQQEGLPLLMEAIRSADHGLVAAAARISMEMRDGNVTRALAKELGRVSADKQIILARILGERQDAAALPALLALSKTGEQSVRLVAMAAATEIGQASSATTLIALLNDPDSEIVQAALSSLAGLPGKEVDEAVISALNGQDRTLKLAMIGLAGQRRISAALPALLKAMTDKNAAVRMAAIRNCGGLVGPAEFPALLERITGNTNPGEVETLAKVLAAICSRADDPQACVPQLVAALSRAGPEAKPALLRTLRVAGGPEALQAVRGAVADTHKAVHAAAISTLSEWKTGDAAPILRDLAKNSGDRADRRLSLRGYLGMAARKEIPAPERLAICREAAPLIQRVEEKKMLLGALGGIAAAESLDLVVPCLDDAEVKGEAVATVMMIAEKRTPKQQAGLTRPALEKIIKISADNQAVVKRATELLKQMEDEK